MMDRLAIEAAKAATGLDWPDVGAALLMDVDGPLAEVEHTSENAVELARAGRRARGPPSRDEAERALMWKGRKSAFAAVGRISPNYIVQDGVIPRSEIARVLREIEALARDGGPAGRQRLPRRRRQPPPARALRQERCRARSRRPRSSAARSCASACGTAARSPASTAWAPTRRAYMAEMFSAEDLDTMGLVRCAFDPDGAVNPGKVFPTPRLCGDRPGPYRPHATEAAGTGLAGMSRPAARPPTAADAVLGVRAGGRLRAGDARGGGRGPRRVGAAAAKSLAFVGGGTELELGAPPGAAGRSSLAHRGASTASSSTRRRTRSSSSRRASRSPRCSAPSRARPAARAGSAAARARDGRGLVAANAFGPRRTRYGSVRDLIIGISFVARRRHARARRRQGGQERRRLRSAEAHGRLARHARADRDRDLPAPPAARGRRRRSSSPGLRTRRGACAARRARCARRSSSRTRSSALGRTADRLRSGRRGSRGSARGVAEQRERFAALVGPRAALGLRRPRRGRQAAGALGAARRAAAGAGRFGRSSRRCRRALEPVAAETSSRRSSARSRRRRASGTRRSVSASSRASPRAAAVVAAAIAAARARLAGGGGSLVLAGGAGRRPGSGVDVWGPAPAAIGLMQSVKAGWTRAPARARAASWAASEPVRAGAGPHAAAAPRGLRPLRLLPAGLPDLAPGARRWTAPRAHRPDARARRGASSSGPTRSRSTSTGASGAWPACPPAPRACATTC